MKKSKILIVEDEVLISMIIENAITTMGHLVCGIEDSGKKAIASAALNSPDLIIMDIKINGLMDGIETAQIIKDSYGIPVIYLTAYADQKILERAKLTEPVGYIPKPFRASELKPIVEVALYKAKMDKKLRKINEGLEATVKQRTQKMADEIAYREKAERQLKLKTDYLKQANKALKSSLDSREAETRAIKEELLLNMKNYAFPYIEMIEQQNPGDEILSIAKMLKETMNDLISPASKTLFARYINLTPQEVKIANLIKNGKNTKEISKFLNIAPSSVSTYRNHIRNKMGLLNSGTNLETYLSSFDS